MRSRYASSLDRNFDKFITCFNLPDFKGRNASLTEAFKGIFGFLPGDCGEKSTEGLGIKKQIKKFILQPLFVPNLFLTKIPITGGALLPVAPR